MKFILYTIIFSVCFNVKNEIAPWSHCDMWQSLMSSHDMTTISSLFELDNKVKKEKVISAIKLFQWLSCCHRNKTQWLSSEGLSQNAAGLSWIQSHKHSWPHTNGHMSQTTMLKIEVV